MTMMMLRLIEVSIIHENDDAAPSTMMHRIKMTTSSSTKTVIHTMDGYIPPMGGSPSTYKGAVGCLNLVSFNCFYFIHGGDFNFDFFFLFFN